MEQDAGDHIVPVGEDIRLDDDRLADHSLDREPSAVDLRLHASITARVRPCSFVMRASFRSQQVTGL